MSASRFLAVLASLALAAAALPAFGQAVTLRYRDDVGTSRLYDRVIQADSQVRAGRDLRRTATEVPAKRQEVILEIQAEPPAARVVVLDTPLAERLTAFEENGQDRLANVPEANRSRALPPVLSTHRRDARGLILEQPATLTDPMGALDAVHGEMRILPEQPVKAGDTWTRDVDFGVVKATITSKFVERKLVQGVACAILESSAAATAAGEFAQRLRLEKLVTRTAVALDGSGWVTHEAEMAVVDKTEKGENRIVRKATEKLAERAPMDAAALAKTKTDLARIDQAMAKVKADDPDGALADLEAYLKENAQGAWTGAVRHLHDFLMQQRLLTKPVPSARLRLMLRDLQTARDRAAAQTASPEVIAQVEQTIRQVAKVNAKLLLEESADPDPLVRDLAAFGLAFVDTDEARAKLLGLAGDSSAQVRGTGVIGLAIQGKPVADRTLLGFIKDADPRTQGAAALLAVRTLTKDSPQAAVVVAALLENLKSPIPWARKNVVSAVVVLTQTGTVPVVRAVLDAGKAETEQALQPLYVQALKMLTTVEGKDLAAYEDWLKKQPAAPPAPKPEPKAPAAPATPKAKG